MTRVEITIHKHECVLCGCLFVWRPPAPDQDGCSCNTHPIKAEFCDPCLKQVNEAGWLGKLVRNLIDHMVVLSKRLETIESKQVAP